MTTELVFVLGDKLPYVSEVVLSIYSYAPGGSPLEVRESKHRKSTVNAYVKALINMWSKAFGAEHVTTRKIVAKKVRKAMAHHFNTVISNRRSSLSTRERLKQWRISSEADMLLDLLKKNSNPDLFSNDEKNFYYAQKDKSRHGYLSDCIDLEYEETKLNEVMENEFQRNEEDEVTELCEEMELSSSDVLNSTLSTSFSMPTELLNINRSGLIRVDEEVEKMTMQERPEIRKQCKTFTEEIKSACAKVSSSCAISVDKARVAVQAVCSELYSHAYYLSKEKQMNSADAGELYSEVSGDEPVAKKSKVPHSTSDYKVYKYVLPSSKIIRNYKNLQATEEETDASMHLLKKSTDEKVTLHFDTTSRCNIDGEWPALILNFSSNARYTLRPLYFAYEDRQNIANLLYETFERLAIAASQVGNQNVTAKYLWEKIDNIMTDSVTKNLKVEHLVAEKFGSTHIPHHLLCKAHVVEKFDETNLKVLSTIETELKMRERLETLNPSLKPFFRGEKAIVVAGIKALTKLISHEKSGNSATVSEEFDNLIEEEGLVKHISLYKERRFTKLGYSAASILQALPQITNVLEQTWKSNLLIEACKLYVNCELFVTELKLLAVFTKKVTLPYLNCIEKCTQEELLKLFPKLYQDLLNHNSDTLTDYHVKYRCVTVPDITTDVEIEIMNRMCDKAAEGFELQSGREYGFGTSQLPSRDATQLHKLPLEELKFMPTDNIISERLLSIFGIHSVVSKYRNKNFTAKGIRDNVMLHNSQQSTVASVAKTVQKLLREREGVWTSAQKELQRERIKKKMKSAESASTYVKKLLQKCKGWGGPCTTPNELETCIKHHTDLSEVVVKTELSYFVNTHKSERIMNRDLFKIMIPHSERLENLMVLLGDNDSIATSMQASVLDLPSNQDLSEALLKPVVTERRLINEMCVVVWQEQDGLQWYLGFVCKELEGNKYRVEHLERYPSTQNDFWRHPQDDDNQDVTKEQILPFKVDGGWNVKAPTTTRIVSTYHLKNSQQIQNAFTKLL